MLWPLYRDSKETTRCLLRWPTCSLALHEGSNSKRIDVIFDVYKEISIKNAEKEKRGAEFGNRFRNIQSKRKGSSGENSFWIQRIKKKAFTEFVVKEWRQDWCRTCKSDCYEITSEVTNTVEELNSTQEEADTRLILQAAHTARLSSRWWLWHQKIQTYSYFAQRLSALFPHVCQVWNADKKKMSVSPMWWKPKEENFASWHACFHWLWHCKCFRWKRKDNSPTTCQATEILRRNV